MFGKLLAFFIIGALVQIGQSTYYPYQGYKPTNYNGYLNYGQNAYNNKLATNDKDEHQVSSSHEYGNESDKGYSQEEGTKHQSEENSAKIKSIQGGYCPSVGGNIHVEEHNNKKASEEALRKLDVRDKQSNYGKSTNSDTTSSEHSRQEEVDKQNANLYYVIPQKYPEYYAKPNVYQPQSYYVYGRPYKFLP